MLCTHFEKYSSKLDMFSLVYLYLCKLSVDSGNNFNTTHHTLNKK